MKNEQEKKTRERNTTYLIIPEKNKTQGYNVFHKKNVIYLDKRLVEKLKKLYGNNTPLDQLRIFYLINHQVLGYDIHEKIKNIVLLGVNNFYEKEIREKKIIKENEKLIQYIKKNTNLFTNGERKLSTHHIIPSSRADDIFNTDEFINKIDVDAQFHSDWHALYVNHTPSEILSKLFEIHKEILAGKIRKKISTIIALNNKEFYRPEVLK